MVAAFFGAGVGMGAGGGVGCVTIVLVEDTVAGFFFARMFPTISAIRNTGKHTKESKPKIAGKMPALFGMRSMPMNTTTDRIMPVTQVRLLK